MSVQTEIVIPAIQDFGGVASGETPSASELNDAFQLLNQIVSSFSLEGATVINRVMQAFNLSAGISAYTLGSGGSFATTGGKRALKILSWMATSGDVRKGGAALPLDQFGMQAADAQKQLAALYTQAALEGVITTVPSALTAPVPSLLGADTNYPLLNVEIWPPPSAAPGQIKIGYYTPLIQFVALGDVIALPDGHILALRDELSIRLAPSYGKEASQTKAANAQSSKGAIVALNQSLLGGQPQQAPQQQQQ